MHTQSATNRWVLVALLWSGGQATAEDLAHKGGKRSVSPEYLPAFASSSYTPPVVPCHQTPPALHTCTCAWAPSGAYHNRSILVTYKGYPVALKSRRTSASWCSVPSSSSAVSAEHPCSCCGSRAASDQHSFRHRRACASIDCALTVLIFVRAELVLVRRAQVGAPRKLCLQ